MIGYLLLAILVFAVVAYFTGRTAGNRFVAANGASVHSLPGYHGAFVAVWVGVPALVLVLLWLALQHRTLQWLAANSYGLRVRCSNRPRRLIRLAW